jgi:hypothetical protein
MIDGSIALACALTQGCRRATAAAHDNPHRSITARSQGSVASLRVPREAQRRRAARKRHCTATSAGLGVEPAGAASGRGLLIGESLGE